MGHTSQSSEKELQALGSKDLGFKLLSFSFMLWLSRAGSHERVYSLRTSPQIRATQWRSVHRVGTAVSWASGRLRFSFLLFFPKRCSGIQEKPEFIMTTHTLRMLYVVAFNISNFQGESLVFFRKD